ncbi:Sak4-like ssDNA annealing protein [Rhizobium phage RHEph06]|uniref:NTP-binding helicase protein n=3 Tax=Kleczkowskavirus RHEph4 TaxID=1921526 RepID=A0A7S5QX22_9CAUD|nr:Sak4-like ssDNA annealing protein [Rhizobium phage RHEph06]AGC35833.1 hypothetical protein RHEph05_gp066 [Rhizobium phage RHEph05]QIG67697.1 NTP-binding helicase protein [Rhizobium phage RHph_Y17]QIG69016.1 NTP-binding helicase protein [Rhizobium phage RHph_Y3_43]QIG69565.1 NTP-binding helicase protein [Rhizobium phage RHph_I36]QIG75439.1 NTP-binding helicase protein [Rhizobium phage RHph_Y1_1]QIG75989.1 NTP-binding helicase protein [Rhizobium phage RHph_Y2_17_2]QXV74951.1 NTP-binding hel
MSQSMMSRIQSTQGFGAKNGVKILVYGLAGRGKTTLCRTCPNPIIMSAESGLLTLARDNLPYLEVRNMNDLRDYYQWAKSSAECRQNFQTLCLDSISEIAEVVLADKKAKVKDGRMAYGEMIDDMHKIIKEFRDIAGYHVYMSAKQERMKNETTGVVMNVPMMPGNKLGQAMPYFPDEVFQLDIEGTGQNAYRRLLCQPDFMTDAKDRSGVLDPIERPDLGYIINKINGAVGA